MEIKIPLGKISLVFRIDISGMAFTFFDLCILEKTEYVFGVWDIVIIRVCFLNINFMLFVEYDPCVP